MDIYEHVIRHLDPDQRLVTPDTYEKYSFLYDEFCDTVCLVGHANQSSEGGFDWMTLYRYGENSEPWTLYSILYLVRVRQGRKSPWGSLNGFLLTYEEYHGSSEMYEILDIYMQILQEGRVDIESVLEEDLQFIKKPFKVLDRMYLVRYADRTEWYDAGGV